MANLNYITDDPVRGGYEQRMRSINEEEDRTRRISEEDRAQARERDLERAYSEGLRNLYQPQPAPQMPAPQQSPMGAPVAPAPSTIAPRAPASPAPASSGLRAVTSARPEAAAAAPAQPSSVDPIMQQLLQNPALAREALTRHQELSAQAEQEREREDAIEAKAIDALAAGDMVTYQYLANQTGMKIDPAIVQDATSRATLARAMNLAQLYFKADPGQAGVFLNAMMTSGGDVVASLQASGMPRSAPNLDLRTILLGDQQVLARIDMLQGTATPLTGPGGKPVQVPITSASGSSEPALVRTARYLQGTMRDEAGNAIGPEQAWQLANQSKFNPGPVFATIYRSVYNEGYGDHAERDERARQAVEGFKAYLDQVTPSQGLYSGQPAPAQPSAAPAVSAPQPAPAAAPAPGGGPGITVPLPPAGPAVAPPPSGSYYDPRTKQVIVRP